MAGRTIFAEDTGALRELFATVLEADVHRATAVDSGVALIDEVRRIVIHGDDYGPVVLVNSDARFLGIDGM